MHSEWSAQFHCFHRQRVLDGGICLQGLRAHIPYWYSYRMAGIQSCLTDVPRQVSQAGITHRLTTPTCRLGHSDPMFHNRPDATDITRTIPCITAPGNDLGRTAPRFGFPTLLIKLTAWVTGLLPLLAIVRRYLCWLNPSGMHRSGSPPTRSEIPPRTYRSLSGCPGPDSRRTCHYHQAVSATENGQLLAAMV